MKVPFKGAIDCDLHPAMPPTSALLPYLDEYWRDQLANRHIDRYRFNLTHHEKRVDRFLHAGGTQRVPGERLRGRDRRTFGAEYLADGLDHHVPKGYVYFAMIFSLSVELLNIYLRRRTAQPVELHERYARE